MVQIIGIKGKQIWQCSTKKYTLVWNKSIQTSDCKVHRPVQCSLKMFVNGVKVVPRNYPFVDTYYFRDVKMSASVFLLSPSLWPGRCRSSHRSSTSHVRCFCKNFQEGICNCHHKCTGPLLQATLLSSYKHSKAWRMEHGVFRFYHRFNPHRHNDTAFFSSFSRPRLSSS